MFDNSHLTLQFGKLIFIYVNAPWIYFECWMFHGLWYWLFSCVKVDCLHRLCFRHGSGRIGWFRQRLWVRSRSGARYCVDTRCARTSYLGSITILFEWSGGLFEGCEGPRPSVVGWSRSIAADIAGWTICFRSHVVALAILLFILACFRGSLFSLLTSTTC